MWLPNVHEFDRGRERERERAKCMQFGSIVMFNNEFEHFFFFRSAISLLCSGHRESSRGCLVPIRMSGTVCDRNNWRRHKTIEMSENANDFWCFFPVWFELNPENIDKCCNDGVAHNNPIWNTSMENIFVRKLTKENMGNKMFFFFGFGLANRIRVPLNNSIHARDPINWWIKIHFWMHTLTQWSWWLTVHNQKCTQIVTPCVHVQFDW